jgi:hypothetical protein
MHRPTSLPTSSLAPLALDSRDSRHAARPANRLTLAHLQSKARWFNRLATSATGANKAVFEARASLATRAFLRLAFIG